MNQTPRLPSDDVKLISEVDKPFISSQEECESLINEFLIPPPLSQENNDISTSYKLRVLLFFLDVILLGFAGWLMTQNETGQPLGLCLIFIVLFLTSFYLMYLCKQKKSHDEQFNQNISGAHEDMQYNPQQIVQSNVSPLQSKNEERRPLTSFDNSSNESSRDDHDLHFHRNGREKIPEIGIFSARYQQEYGKRILVEFKFKIPETRHIEIMKELKQNILKSQDPWQVFFALKRAQINLNLASSFGGGRALKYVNELMDLALDRFGKKTYEEVLKHQYGKSSSMTTLGHRW